MSSPNQSTNASHIVAKTNLRHCGLPNVMGEKMDIVREQSHDHIMGAWLFCMVDRQPQSEDLLPLSLVRAQHCLDIARQTMRSA